MKFAGIALFATGTTLAAATPLKRNVHISGKEFFDVKANATVVLGGPNVVVKGYPYMPAVEGNTICNDVVGHTLRRFRLTMFRCTDTFSYPRISFHLSKVNDLCTAHGNCSTCSTFNQADVDHIKSRGWNFIRLGVVWAGAQPRDEDALDPDFLKRLHAVLELTDKNGVHVMLDNHGDMVGTLGCGNGVPAW